MKNPSNLAMLTLALVLSGCAMGPPLLPGTPLTEVQARLGRPGAVYPAGADTLLEYATGPAGQYTYMARVGADDRLISYEQVLTDQKFATLKIGIAIKADVLRTVGRPAETSFLGRPVMEIWSYRYKQSGVWDAMMHVHFDPGGIVRKMESGPDPEREERRDFFGFFR
jgi:hypothetical protein